MSENIFNRYLNDQELIRAAAIHIAENEKVSIEMLQRFFKIGFSKASKIMDVLEKKGIVGPEMGVQPRDILTNMEELLDFFDNNSLEGETLDSEPQMKEIRIGFV